MRLTPIAVTLTLALAAGPALAQSRVPRPTGSATTVTCIDPPFNRIPPGCTPRVDGGGGKSSVNPLAALTDDLLRKLLADFTYAHEVSKATSNKITEPCWGEWVSLLTKQQQPVCVAAPAGAPPPDPAAPPNLCASGQVQLVKPDPHLVTDAEFLSEFIQQLQPNSPLSLACAPVLQASQKDIATLVGTVLSGGVLGLFKIPGL